MKRTIAALLIPMILVFITVLVPISFGPLNEALIRIIENRVGAKISCRSLNIYVWRSLVAEGVKAVGKGGFALSAEKAEISYDLTSLITGRLHVSCRLSDVKFYKGTTVMDSISDMLFIEPLGDMAFEKVKVDLFIGKQDTITHDLSLLSDNIRIYGKAFSDKDDNIKCLLRFDLKDELLKEIPEEIRGAIFNKEEDAWSNINVGLMGNYGKPNIRIITERIRMNIAL